MNTRVLSIALIATAVVLIGGPAIIPTITIPTAFATTGQEGNQPDRVTICHIPPDDPDNPQTITVAESAVNRHVQQHGDTIGPCPPDEEPPEDESVYCSEDLGRVVCFETLQECERYREIFADYSPPECQRFEEPPPGALFCRIFEREVLGCGPDFP